MAKQQERTAAVQALVDEAARKLSIWLDGSAEPSPSLSFEAIEQFGVEVGDAVARAVMQQALEEQASESTTEVCRCGAPLEPRDAEWHELLTRRGLVGWDEPVGYCSRCRRDFFPSVPDVGPAAG
ncbi:MAG TPA: hypothetical protein VMP01_08010 [Pirellulaceae bacterium]|nr:hypothetical protein [Pirellulaceae bacterium]